MSVITPSTSSFAEDSHLIELYGISEFASAVSTTHHIQNTLNLKYRSSTRHVPPVAATRHRVSGGAYTSSVLRKNASLSKNNKQPEMTADTDGSSDGIHAAGDVTATGNATGTPEETETEDGGDRHSEEKEEEERRERLKALRNDEMALTKALHETVNHRNLTDCLLRHSESQVFDGGGGGGGGGSGDVGKGEMMEEESLDDTVVCYDWLEAMRGWRKVTPFARYVYVSPAVVGPKRKKKNSNPLPPPPPQQQQQAQQQQPKADCDIVMPYVLPLESDHNFPPKPKLKSAKRGGRGGSGGGVGRDGESTSAAGGEDTDSRDSDGEDGLSKQQPQPVFPRDVVAGVPNYMRDTYLSRYHRLQREREREREKEYKEREEKLRMHYLKDDELVGGGGGGGKWRGGRGAGKDDSSSSTAQNSPRAAAAGQNQQRNKPETTSTEGDLAKKPEVPKRPRQILPVVEGKAKISVQTFPLEDHQQHRTNESYSSKDDDDEEEAKKDAEATRDREKANASTEDENKQQQQQSDNNNNKKKSILKIPATSINATKYCSSSPAGIMDVPLKPSSTTKALKGRNVEIDIIATTTSTSTSAASNKDHVASLTSSIFPGGISKFVANNAKIQSRKERFSLAAASTTTTTTTASSDSELDKAAVADGTGLSRLPRSYDDRLWQVPGGGGGGDHFGPSVVKPVLKNYYEDDKLLGSIAEGGSGGGGGGGGGGKSGQPRVVPRYPATTVLSKSLLTGPSSLALENLIPVLDREIEKDLELRKKNANVGSHSCSNNGGKKKNNSVSLGPGCKDSPRYGSRAPSEYSIEKWSARDSLDSNDSGFESCCVTSMQGLTGSGGGDVDRNDNTNANNNKLKPLEKVTPSQRHRKDNNLATCKNNEYQHHHHHPSTSSLDKSSGSPLTTTPAPMNVKSTSSSKTTTTTAPHHHQHHQHHHLANVVVNSSQKVSLFSQLPIATVYNFEPADSSAVISLSGTGYDASAAAVVTRGIRKDARTTTTTTPMSSYDFTNNIVETATTTTTTTSRVVAGNQFSKVSFKTSNIVAHNYYGKQDKRRKSVALPLQTFANDSAVHATVTSLKPASRRPLLPPMATGGVSSNSGISSYNNNNNSRSNGVDVRKNQRHLPLTEGISGISLKETTSSSSRDKSRSAEFLPTISGKHLHAL